MECNIKQTNQTYIKILMYIFCGKVFVVFILYFFLVDYYASYLQVLGNAVLGLQLKQKNKKK